MNIFGITSNFIEEGTLTSLTFDHFIHSVFIENKNIFETVIKMNTNVTSKLY